MDVIEHTKYEHFLKPRDRGRNCLFKSFKVVAAWQRGRIAANKVPVNLPLWQHGRVYSTVFVKYLQSQTVYHVHNVSNDMVVKKMHSKKMYSTRSTNIKKRRLLTFLCKIFLFSNSKFYTQ